MTLTLGPIEYIVNIGDALMARQASPLASKTNNALRVAATSMVRVALVATKLTRNITSWKYVTHRIPNRARGLKGFILAAATNRRFSALNLTPSGGYTSGASERLR